MDNNELIRMLEYAAEKHKKRIHTLLMVATLSIVSGVLLVLLANYLFNQRGPHIIVYIPFGVGVFSALFGILVIISWLVSYVKSIIKSDDKNTLENEK